VGCGKFGESDKVYSLRETVYDGEDGGVTLGWGQPGDEVECNVGQRATGNRQGKKQTSWGLMGSLATTTDTVQAATKARVSASIVGHQKCLWRSDRV